MGNERANILLGLLLVCALVIVVTGVLIVLQPAKTAAKPNPTVNEIQPPKEEAADSELLAGSESAELRGMTEAARQEQEAFLASRANIRTGALDELCRQAAEGATPDVRRDAIRRLATSDAYKKERCALDAVLDRMKNEQDSSTQREAICVLYEFGRVPESDVILIDILSRFARKEIEKTEDRNLVGAVLGAVRSQKSEEAIPVLLEYLDCPHINFVREADEILSHITGLKAESGTRADWEAALEEK